MAPELIKTKHLVALLSLRTWVIGTAGGGEPTGPRNLLTMTMVK